MRIFLVAVILVFSASSAFALKGKSGGLGFECTVGGKCTCDGPVESADCKGAAKNCSDGVKCPCGWAVDNCCCTYKVRKAPQSPGVGKLPNAGTLKKQ
jgi:hypothetical protein